MLNDKRLPHYVLEKILLYCVYERFDGIEDWKQRIPLVGVCKKWTDILRPAVFSTAYLYYSPSNGRREWETNIDCIAIRGWFNRVKSVNIRITFPVNAMLVLNKLQSILQLDIINWRSIVRLNIVFDINDIGHSSNYLGILDKRTVDFTRKLIFRMPNVIGLHIRLFYNANFLQQLMLLVVNAYSAQLQLLDIWPILNMPRMHLGSNLAFLTLEFSDNIFKKHMSICAEPLRELCLYKVPADIPWHIFHSNSDPGQINFKNLQKLVILYDNADGNDYSHTQLTPAGFAIANSINNSTDHTVSATNGNYIYKLLFPNIKKLYIQRCSNEYIPLNVEFGRTLDVFKLSGKLQDILQWVTIPQSTQKLEMTIDADKKVTATDNTRMLNKLLKVTARYYYRILNISRISAEFYLPSVVWGNINMLVITDIDITDIITLLSTTPRLKKLIVYSIVFGDYTTLDKVEQLFQQRVDTQLFALDLKALVIRCNKEYNHNAFLAVIYNLMTHAKSLSQIDVPEKFVSQVMMIIDVQKDYYPHFAKIHVLQLIKKFLIQIN